MPSRVRCFWLTPTENVSLRLRRFAAAGDGRPKCTYNGPRYPGSMDFRREVHDVEIEIGRERGTIGKHLDGDYTMHTVLPDDARWPTHCTCGYEFAESDTKQEGRTRLYQREDTGELVAVAEAPAGALYDSRSFNDVDGYQRNGGNVSIVCKTPAGEWFIDGPASNGPGWTRTGTIPNITVNPSIGIGNPQRMHGWLRDGWLDIDMP